MKSCHLHNAICICHLHNVSFNFVTLGQFTLSLSLRYSLKFNMKLQNYRMRAYMVASAYRVISKEAKNQSLRHN